MEGSSMLRKKMDLPDCNVSVSFGRCVRGRCASSLLRRLSALPWDRTRGALADHGWSWSKQPRWHLRSQRAPTFRYPNVLPDTRDMLQTNERCKQCGRERN